MAKKRLTPNQQAYNKEINRIRRFIKRAEKRGFIFDENVIPQLPKRVTKKALNKIQELKPTQLYEQSYVVIEDTGELISGAEARKIERSIVAEKARQTRKARKLGERTQAQKLPNVADIIISNFKSYILAFPESLSGRLIAWLNALITQQGKEDVAYMIENTAITLGDYLSRMGYDSKTAISEFTQAMMNYLPNASDAFKRDLQEAFENEELGYDVEEYAW